MVPLWGGDKRRGRHQLGPDDLFDNRLREYQCVSCLCQYMNREVEFTHAFHPFYHPVLSLDGTYTSNEQRFQAIRRR